MQETHYNNPDLVANRADSSGMRLYYTAKLRPNDIGILEIGLEYSAKNSIPPGQANFELQGHCVPECTRIGLPANGINVVASQLHTHLTGEQACRILLFFFCEQFVLQTAAAADEDAGARHLFAQSARNLALL